VLVYDVISAFSAGLVIRFFPIFFLHDLHLSPVTVCAVSVCSSVAIAVFGSAAQALARFGRVPVTFGFRLLGIGSFFAMAVLQSTRSSRLLVIGAYLLRMGLVNSTHGLTKSIVHDMVRPAERARYASIDSINQATVCAAPATRPAALAASGRAPPAPICQPGAPAGARAWHGLREASAPRAPRAHALVSSPSSSLAPGACAAIGPSARIQWAGSAALGGLVIDRFGMVANFYVTASAQAFALVPIWIARKLVADERAHHIDAPQSQMDR
jgi:hypothetical protein